MDKNTEANTYPEAPASMVKKIVSMSTLAPGEYYVVCPYESSHIVRNANFGKHVANCRLSYKTKQGTLVMLPCKYNKNHQVPAREIHYHEYACTDRKTADWLGDYTQKRPVEEGLENLQIRGGDREDSGVFGSGSDEDDVMTQLSLVNSDDGSLGLGSTLGAEADFDKTPTNQHSFVFPARGQEEDNVFHVRKPRLSHRRQLQAWSDGRAKWFPTSRDEREEDSEEWWKPNRLCKGFDYMENWSKGLKQPIFKFPPNLTKAQRKIFVKENTERMALEMGHFDPNGEYATPKVKPEEETKPVNPLTSSYEVKKPELPKLIPTPTPGLVGVDTRKYAPRGRGSCSKSVRSPGAFLKN